MAVARDAASSATSSGSGTTTSFSFTTSGSNRALLVAAVDQGGNTVTGATYNSVAMTQLKVIQLPNISRYLYVFGLLAPATGANTVLVTRTGSGQQFNAAAISYTGVLQSGLPDASTTNSIAANPANLTTTLTTLADNAIAAIFAFNDNGVVSASTGTTQVMNDSGVDLFIGESSTFPIHPAGSYSMAITGPGGAADRVCTVMVSLAPVAGPAALTVDIENPIRQGVKIV